MIKPLRKPKKDILVEFVMSESRAILIRHILTTITLLIVNMHAPEK